MRDLTIVNAQKARTISCFIFDLACGLSQPGAVLSKTVVS